MKHRMEEVLCLIAGVSIIPVDCPNTEKAPEEIKKLKTFWNSKPKCLIS